MAKSEKFTCKQVIEAIKDSHGLKAAIARRLGCHVTTINNYIERHPSVARAYQNEREAIVDLGESVIIQALKDSDAVTARWVCATLGKDRGYSEEKRIVGGGKQGEHLVMVIEGLDESRL